jgi:hypothetical protein
MRSYFLMQLSQQMITANPQCLEFSVPPEARDGRSWRGRMLERTNGVFCQCRPLRKRHNSRLLHNGSRGTMAKKNFVSVSSSGSSQQDGGGLFRRVATVIGFDAARRRRLGAAMCGCSGK